MKKNKNIAVDIIIVSYNTKELTRNCLRSILAQTKDIDFEIWVVDNASTDGSAEMIRKEFPQIKIIENQKNLGFGKANNVAIRKSWAKYIFCLNPDTILLNNAVKIFYDFMENAKNKNVGCCGGNLYNKDMTLQISYGNFPSLKQIVFEQFGLSKIFKNYYEKDLSAGVKSYDNQIKEVDYISGADMFIRRSALDEIGLFDPDFFLYYEETELSYRMNQKGFKSIIVPQARIIHLIGGGNPFKNFDLTKIKIMKMSEFLFFKKCYGYGNFSKFLMKFLYKIGYLSRLILKSDRRYLDLIRIIDKI